MEELYAFGARRVGTPESEVCIDYLEQRFRDAGLEDVRLHDLRHSFASVAASGGLSLPMIGKLLGHTQAATTERYAHLAADPVRAANEAIGERIAAAMRGGGAEVVKMPKRKQGA